MAAGDGLADDGGARASVEIIPNGGIRIDDRTDRRSYTVRTGGAISPTPVAGDWFRYPTDIAVSFSTDRLELDPAGTTLVHGADSSTPVELFNRESFPDGRYVVDLSGPLKLYIVVSGPCTVTNGVDELTVDLERHDTVVVGARSYHDRPTATVTVTEDPADVMAAVSTFGAELRTQTSKRSWPTLRGHPPMLTVGDALSIPDEVEPPDGDVKVQVPADLEYVLPSAPLSYYLGAPVTPAPDPALVVDGTRYGLDGAGGFEATVERVLQRAFFLDCLVRTAGQREPVLHELEQLEGVLNVDPAALHGRSPTERLRAYMDVESATIEEYLPDWNKAALVQPARAGIEALPFLVYDLAVIRVPQDGSTGAVDGSRRVDASSDGRSGGAAAPREVVRPPPADAVERTWAGPGVPVGASKAMPTAFRNRLNRERREDERVEVAVVCNDEGMLEEGDTAREAYGSNQRLPFDVTFHDALDTAGLRGVFRSDLDYVHYIGHVSDGGIECTDGTLDVGRMDEVGVDIAFLNACQSCLQGFELIDRGAIASVVTFGEVHDDGALRIGTSMARLLNQGFPLDRALSIARDRSIVGSQYLVLGDPDADIAQPSSLVPWVTAVEQVGPDEYRLRITPSFTRSAGMGAVFRPAVGDDPPAYLVPKTLPEATVTQDRLREYLASDTFPVVMDGAFTWSNEALEEL